MRGAARWALWCGGSGVLAGSVALALGVVHNTQGEFVDTASGQVDLAYCGIVFGSWFVAAALAVGLLLALVAGLGRLFARRSD